MRLSGMSDTFGPEYSGVNMTVKDLMEFLKTVPPHYEVLVANHTHWPLGSHAVPTDVSFVQTRGETVLITLCCPGV